MAVIKVDLDALAAKEKALKTVVSELEHKLANANLTIEELQSYWVGGDATEFRANYSEGVSGAIQTGNSLRDYIDMFSDHLDSACKYYSEMQAEIVKAAQRV